MLITHFLMNKSDLALPYAQTQHNITELKRRASKHTKSTTPHQITPLKPFLDLEANPLSDLFNNNIPEQKVPFTPEDIIDTISLCMKLFQQNGASQEKLNDGIDYVLTVFENSYHLKN